MTIEGININEDIDLIMGCLKRAILEYKLFIEKYPDYYDVCLWDEKNHNYLYSFSKDSELERIDSDVVKKL